MSNSPQFQRTNKAIIQAMINLLKTKPFEKITVQDILDETPVTRATFYAHFQDKYEIAERMLAQFFELKESVKKNAHTGTSTSFSASMEKIFNDNRDLTNALLKIHTGKVDFRQAIANELKRDYLAMSTSPNKEIEARVYSQAYAELHLAYIDSPFRDFSLEGITEICMNITLHLLGLDGDDETRLFLYNRIAKNTIAKPKNIY